MWKLSHRLSKPLGQGRKIAKWLSQDLNSGSLNPEPICSEPIQTTATSAEDIMMSRTDMTSIFTELIGKKLYLTINCNEDVFDVRTHSRGIK